LIKRFTQEILPGRPNFLCNEAKVGLALFALVPARIVFRVACLIGPCRFRVSIRAPGGPASPAPQLLLPPLQVFAKRGAQAILPVVAFDVGHGRSDMRAPSHKIKINPASFPSVASP
jgi:hypothetical protein